MFTRKEEPAEMGVKLDPEQRRVVVIAEAFLLEKNVRGGILEISENNSSGVFSGTLWSGASKTRTLTVSTSGHWLVDSEREHFKLAENGTTIAFTELVEKKT